MTFPYGEPIGLIHNGEPTVNRYGDPVPAQTEVTVTGAFNPGTSTENAGQDTAATQPAVYLPAGTDVTWVDAVRARGAVYQVDGSPNDWSNPFTGTGFGVEVRLAGILAEPR